MSAPKNLDPFTLRWLADEEDGSREYATDLAADCIKKARELNSVVYTDLASQWRDRATFAKCRARWFRNLATRAEKKRGGR